MQGQFIRFYLNEASLHRGRPEWEWLLEQARNLGIGGGSAFKAMAGFGRHRVLHESRFFELGGELPVEVEFIATDAQVARLLDLLRAEKVEIVYAVVPARFGVSGKETGEGSPVAWD
jgi:PII-like signaling protein